MKYDFLTIVYLFFGSCSKLAKERAVGLLLFGKHWEKII